MVLRHPGLLKNTPRFMYVFDQHAMPQATGRQGQHKTSSRFCYARGHMIATQQVRKNVITAIGRIVGQTRLLETYLLHSLANSQTD